MNLTQMTIIKRNNTNGFTKQKETGSSLENELMVAGGRNNKGVWEGHVHTAIFKIDNKQGPIV